MKSGVDSLTFWFSFCFVGLGYEPNNQQMKEALEQVNKAIAGVCVCV